ncbi:MAG: zinc ABC transporter substrate-binding protein [Clostridia bacterium]|nr:zinc ABC transporter substrate-binding protein [Clostridia bacterium]
MRNFRRTILLFLAAVSVLVLASCRTARDRQKPLVVATNFAAYDLSRSLCSGFADVRMLLSPGNESHDFEATVSDIAMIERCDLFVFTGGESDEWIEDLFDAMGDRAEKINTFAMMDHVDLLTEQIPGIISSSEEYDEHVWTSPKNTLIILGDLAETMSGIFPDHAGKINSSLEDCSSKIRAADERLREIISSASRRTIIVADRFPFKYLCEEYGLSYYAAFTGCTSNTEPSLPVIGSLVNRVREENIPVIFTTELSDRQTAEFISGETGARIMTLHSAHNVTKEEFDEGVTYAELMEQNAAALEAALK